MKKQRFNSLILTIFMISLVTMANKPSLTISSTSAPLTEPKPTSFTTDLAVGSQLTYHFVYENGDFQPEDDKEGNEGIHEGVIRADVMTIDLTNDMVYYDLKYPTPDPAGWVWVSATPTNLDYSKWGSSYEPWWDTRDGAYWMENQATLVYNHTFSFSPGIDLSLPAVTTELNTSLANQFDDIAYSNMPSSLEFRASNSTSGNTLNITAAIDQTTGILVYYHQEDSDGVLTLELAENTIFLTPTIDTFGFYQGDVIERFEVGNMDNGGDEGDKDPYDDVYEVYRYWIDDQEYSYENDDLTTPAHLPTPFAYNEFISKDVDYYNFTKDSGYSLSLEIYCPDGSGWSAELFNNDESYNSTFTSTADWLNLNMPMEWEGTFIIEVESDFSGEWYELKIMNDVEFPDDWLEYYTYGSGENDVWYEPSQLEDPREHYHSLDSTDVDYYRFHVHQRNVMRFSLFDYPSGIGFEVQELNPDTGSFIESRWSDEGHLEWVFNGPETECRDVLIRVTCDSPGQSYSMAVENIGYDGDDHFSMEVIEYVYENPYTNEHVLVMSKWNFKDRDMTEFIGGHMMVGSGRVNLSDPISSVGGENGYFDKNIDWTSTAFENYLNDIFTNQMGWTSFSLTTETSSGSYFIEMSGINEEGEDATIFVQQLGGTGTFRYMMDRSYNSSNDEERMGIQFILDYTINGVDGPEPTDSTLGVSEGMSWSIVAFSEYEGREWNSSSTDGDDYWGKEHLVYQEYTITDIFRVNHTVMAILGTISIWDSDHSIMLEEESFAPFLIYDTAQPTSFIKPAGFPFEMDGPPAVLPAVDWTTYQSALISDISNQPDFISGQVDYRIEPNIVRFRWFEDTSNLHDEGQVLLETSDEGIVTHIEFRSNYREEDGLGWGIEKYDETRGFVFEMDPSSMSNAADPSLVTDISTADVLVWDNQRYRPDDDTTYRHNHQKITIFDVVSACDGSTVFLGQRHYRENSETTWTADIWYADEDETMPINAWMLSSVRDNDLWSWMNGQIFDKGITDLATYTQDGLTANQILADILNFAFSLPSGTIAPADIIVDGTTFETSISATKDSVAIDHVFKLAINEEGILQDMFMGDYNPATGDWLEWERTILTQSPGNDGEYWEIDDLPMYEPVVPSDEGGFSLPSYPISIFAIFSILGIAIVVLKKKKN